MDPEPGIRTNTVICLGKIAKYLSDSVSKSKEYYGTSGLISLIHRQGKRS